MLALFRQWSEVFFSRLVAQGVFLLEKIECALNQIMIFGCRYMARPCTVCSCSCLIQEHDEAEQGSLRSLHLFEYAEKTAFPLVSEVLSKGHEI